MVYPRPSAAIRSGSPLPGLGWGAKKVTSIHDAANKLRAAGDLTGLESLYSQALERARGQHNTPDQITQLISLGDVHLLQFRYSMAIAEYFAARKLAQASDDAENLGLVSLTLSSLYQQIGDPEDALVSAEESRAAFARSGSSRYQAYLLLILARYYSSRHDAQAEGLFLEGIEAARRQGDLALEAQGWDLLGEYRLASGDIAGAERATVESFRLRVLHYPADLRFSYRRLGALRLAQGLQNEPSSPPPGNRQLPNEPSRKSSGSDELQNEPNRTAPQPGSDELPNEPSSGSRSRDLEEAMLLTQKALAGSRDAKSILGSWELLHQQGRIQEAQGLPLEAIQSYGAAVDQAALWWRTLPTAAASLIGANAALHHQVFNSFVEAAAHRALETGDQRLAAESFMAEEFNRASSLRETQALAPVWRSKLPPAYWETLAQLRTEDTGSCAETVTRLRPSVSV
jgi:tetratricopeptide (TPR) repeat protein